MSFQGSLLIASPLLVEPTFHRTVVLLLEHDDDGAMGLILNRPSQHQVVDHLPEWAVAVPDPGLVFVGGPVEPEVAIGLTSSGIGGSTSVPGLAMLDLDGVPSEGLDSVRIYSGYSGWSSGQLEMEIADGAWYVVPAAPDDVFGRSEGMWSRILRRQEGRLAILASFPPDPSLN